MYIYMCIATIFNTNIITSIYTCTINNRRSRIVCYVHKLGSLATIFNNQPTSLLGYKHVPSTIDVRGSLKCT